MSYVSQQFLLFDCGSLADFKNWAQAISQAFSSAGWTQTSDTGQVNWSTIASVPTSGSPAYEIWQPGDALQTGSTKLFVKVTYSGNSSGGGGPCVTFQASTSTNGSGTLNGFSSAAYGSTGSMSGQGSVITYACYFSGDTNRMGLALWTNLGGISGNNTFNFQFWIERTHNTDGTDSSDGFTLGCNGSSFGAAISAPGQQTVVFGVGAATLYSTMITISRGGNSLNQVTNNNIPVCPVFPEYGKIGNPVTGCCIVGSSLVLGGVVFTTTLYGATRTYLAVFSGNGVVSSGISCMRYD